MQCLRMFLSDIIGDLLEYAREGRCVPPRSSIFHSFFSASTNVPNANECIVVTMRLVVASFKKRTIKQRFPIICATVFLFLSAGSLLMMIEGLCIMRRLHVPSDVQMGRFSPRPNRAIPHLV